MFSDGPVRFAPKTYRKQQQHRTHQNETRGLWDDIRRAQNTAGVGWAAANQVERGFIQSAVTRICRIDLELVVTQVIAVQDSVGGVVRHAEDVSKILWDTRVRQLSDEAPDARSRIDLVQCAAAGCRARQPQIATAVKIQVALGRVAPTACTDLCSRPGRYQGSVCKCCRRRPPQEYPRESQPSLQVSHR
jgi:hypothetical protein